MYLVGKVEVYVTYEETDEKKLMPYISSIDINNDSQHIGSTCDIVIPTNHRFLYDLSDTKFRQPLTAEFSTGDKIEIRAKYEGYDWQTIFEGFMVDFYQGMPTKIACTDYVYKLNLSPITISYPKTVKLVDLIKRIIKGTGVEMMQPNKVYTDANGHSVTNPLLDMTLFNISFTNMTPSSCLEYLKKEMGFNISLLGNKLYVNLASNTTETAKYDTRVNVISSDLQSNALKRYGRTKKGSSIFLKIKLKAWFYLKNGKKGFLEVGDPDGQLREVFFWNVKQSTSQVKVNGKLYPKNYLDLANEALEKARQRRYNGSLTSYLFPEVDVFWRVEYKDFRYHDKNGVYVCTSNNLRLDENGFRRTIKLAFLNELQS